MARHTPSARPPRGASLLEALIALSVLLIGLLGMAQLQIWGVSSNQGARANAQALEIARELAAALERIPYDDALLAPTVGSPPPSTFGKVIQLDGSLDPSSFTSWDDSMAPTLVNVRPDTVFERDAIDSSLPAFQRRWAVWAPTGLTANYIRVIAVSVLYREKTFQQAREVTLLTQVSNVGATLSNAAAFR
jgi:hypothetical protein